ncbi:dimethylglycine dehydrogenase, mitochondrial [Caerostris darwini]|uniref:Dimethylglycine dehydrogenase, mitochondrial n=1 Tax=Caerostris darwini TaxID=1538125 RepID=A0AAV4W180_9ARAC|nr:dimethylglycine dehydrogenase, mitochondrial [Caerostris darwini]
MLRGSKFSRFRLNSKRFRILSSEYRRQRSSAHVPEKVQAVVIGGGAVGTSITYHLARFGMKDVLLLEKSELTAGSTWHAAGLTALYHPGINMKKLHYDSINLFSQLEAETGQSLSFHRPGSIRLATTEERLLEFKYQMQRQGWQKAPQKIIRPEEIARLFPLLNMDGILGGLYNPYDGHIDPYSLTMAYASGARKYGATITLGSPVEGLKPRKDGTWDVVTPQGTIVAEKVINASGFWAHEIGRLTNTELPLVPVEHQYMITKPLKEVKELKTEPPVLRHLEGSFYMRTERGGLLIGPYEHQTKMQVLKDWANKGVPKGFGKELFQPNLDRLSDHLEVAMNLVPVLKDADVQTVVNGPIMYTPDLLPLLGPYYGLPNMWMAVGFGYGIIHSGGAGKYLASWIKNGEPPFDLNEADPNRFGKWTSKEYIFEKAAETYGMNNNYTYPKEERFAGRPTARVSGAYRAMLERGAEMGFHAGWEQPAWFSKEGDLQGYQPSFRRTNWFDPVGRECRLIMDKVGILDLTPFAKIDVTGPDSAAFLDKMLANKLPKQGKTNISHLLTPSGKVYAELTVTKMNDEHFFLITGSGSEIHDLRWLNDHARSWNSNVNFQNLTDEMACLSIAGPFSRNVLSKLTEDDVGERAFPFLSAKIMKIAGIPVRALRISYTGELGWELYHPSEHTLLLYEALFSAGQEFGIGDFGTYALNALRIEKGFRMWGTEMNMDSNPLEAGLDYFIRMDKEDFIGKSSLQQILKEGLNRKLAYLKIHSSDVDAEGNESVWCCDKVVGYTTSGAFGYTVNHGVAFAYLPPFLTVPTTKVQVELLGELVEAEVLPSPPVEIEAIRRKKKKQQ